MAVQVDVVEEQKMIANLSSKGTGCGCGGGGTLSVAPCGCGGAGCGECYAQGIVRPRFFAGQLLTEDDLQLLTDYVGQKNRLHNRHLFGAGVVCGLEVTCHPCGDGRVIVHPGFALDCCGNDLVLSCPQILDMNAMVRDLRRDTLGGFDCGDPCPDPPTSATKKTTEGQGLETETETKPGFRYCLYIRYCEQPSDPVTPYSTGEECVQVGCEPTRVREGVKFELKCQSPHEPVNPLIQRLCACVGDLDKFWTVLSEVRRVRRYGQVFARSQRKDAAKFGPNNISDLRTAAAGLSRLIGQPIEKTAAERRADAINTLNRAEGATLKREIDQQLIQNYEAVTILVNRFDELTPTEQQAIIAAQPQAGEIITKAQDAVLEVNQSSLSGAAQSFNDVRDWLIERLNKSPFITDCTLQNRVYALVLPRANGSVTKTELSTAADNTSDLVEAFIDYVRDCACRALNPACLPCEDSGVLLACLEWKECQVLKICNMERTLVLSPAAINYSLPPLQLLGNVVERLCCVDWDDLPRNGNEEDPNLGKLLKRRSSGLSKARTAAYRISLLIPCSVDWMGFLRTVRGARRKQLKRESTHFSEMLPRRRWPLA
jgi:hypothetical protein